jgi:lysophospholipase L1-like esterase
MNKLGLCCAVALSIALSATAQNNVTDSMTTSTPPLVENRSPHYYARLEAFKAEKPIGRREIVMLGNSLTENGGNWGIRLSRKHLRNRGIIGDDASGMYARLEEILQGKPKKIILMAGINDVSHDLSVDSIVTLVTQLVDKIRQDSPRTKLLLQSLLPINESFQRYRRLDGKTNLIPLINERLAKLAHERRLTFLNLFPLFTEEGNDVLRKELTTDGLHLNEEGYKIWEETLKDVL